MSDIVNLESLREFLNINESEKINFAMIKEFCKVADIRFCDSKNVFVKKGTVEEEAQRLQALVGRTGSTVAYKNMYVNHPIYSYYQYFVIDGSLLDLKKVLKISKLKAFL
jgi:DNA-directed RNA polymerase delta subunit